ncbi:imidazole glycerol phosphate synthase subunit HisF [Candidatus Marinamargulisbacteria bacterium SCGC AG-333-B06]|nr:imidazole glycerol phosphate synthase subunit HisF [Candidatus Marinamargulisbacteria bacterium SCGC AG-333-B06]
MFQRRIIPTLLLSGNKLVKTTQFKNPNYLGDPINAVKIFNLKEVDELCLLDIDASKNNKQPNYNLIADIASEAFMPLSYGGGITSLDQIKHIFDCGVDKVILESAALDRPKFVTEASTMFGSQSIVASLSVKKNRQGEYAVYGYSGMKRYGNDFSVLVKQIEKHGAGEIMIYSIDHDGMMQGFDLDLIKSVADKVSVPVLACGGAGSLNDIHDLVKFTGINGIGVGSLFVYVGRLKGVLIHYPTRSEIEEIIYDV